jgi:hypothetical protein
VDGKDNDNNNREEERAAVGSGGYMDGSGELLTLLTRTSMVVKSNQILEWTNHVQDNSDNNNDVTKE